MATAGDRYTERTGNIWSYAYRNDLSGLKAAIARGVPVNIQNTVGWTPVHAAAAGGSLKALRYLAKLEGVQLDSVDNGGNTPAHQAAKEWTSNVAEAASRTRGGCHRRPIIPCPRQSDSRLAHECLPARWWPVGIRVGTW